MNLSLQQGWELAGWTMCYFLAIGTCVAIVSSVIRFALRGFSPALRYAWSLSVFASLSVLPIAIAVYLWPQQQLQNTEPPPVAVAAAPPTIDLKDLEAAQPVDMPTLENPDFAPSVETLATAAPVVQPSLENVLSQDGEAIDLLIAYLPWLWFLGTPLTFLLLATGLIGSHRLRSGSQLLTEGPIFDTCQHVRRSLAVSQQVAVSINERIASPLLIGIVRPMILLPPAALTGWSPDQLEMVLLHELAHVRRWDNLVNLVQRIVESLLFFHPCVWWVSRWVRTDREQCCDAAVVAHTSEPRAYAELLVALATPTTPLAGLAMAQHPLAGRIRRILKLEEEKMLVSRGTITLAGTALAVLLAALLWAPLENSAAEEPAATTNTDVTQSAESDSQSGEIERPKKIVQEAAFEALTPVSFASAEEERIWKATQDALIRSKVVLQRAIRRITEDDTLTKVPELEWLQRNLKIRFIPGAVILGFEENRERGIHSGVIKYYLKYIGESYRQELLQQRRIAAETPQPRSPFLPLEDQRAADLAYKMLGLELEPLSEEELKRVKALGHAGGVRVSSNRELGRIQRGDLLVGLHVWPIASVGDVVRVLRRSDIAELSPLKFFAARKGWNSGDPQNYQVFTGRITANISAVSPSNSSFPQEYVLATGDAVKIVVVGSLPDQPIADVYRIESMGTVALGPTYGRIKVVGLTLLEAEQKVKQQLSTILKDVAVQITLHKASQQQTVARSDGLESSLPNNFGMAKLQSPQSNQLDLEAAKSLLEYAEQAYDLAERKLKRTTALSDKGMASQSEVDQLQAEVARTKFELKRAQANVERVRAATEQTKSSPTLLYDNKTFDQWRALWKNELKTEKRTEAIKAMAAFGRAGYGKEAAEAILDVAGEYDFTHQHSSKPVENLKDALYEVLSGSDPIAAEYWLPELLDRLDQDPKEWSGLYARVANYIPGLTPELMARTIEFADNESYSAKVRATAITCVANTDYGLKEQTTVELLRKALTSDKPELMTAALGRLHYRHLDKLPEQFDLFFHGDQTVRQSAYRNLMGTGDHQITASVVDKLLAVLNDPERQPDHPSAVRALMWNAGWLGQAIPHKKSLLSDRLIDVLVNAEKALLRDAIVALSRLHSETSSLVIKRVAEVVSPKRYEELKVAAQDAESNPSGDSTRSGGGFGGGGGGGFF